MSYCTQDDLTTRYGESELIQLTDRAGLGEIDATALGQAIADTDAEIDARLGGRYPVPLASVPPVLRRLACEICYYLLWHDQVPELVETRARDARKLLAEIGAGSVSLGLEQPPAPSGGAEFTAGAHVWGRDSGGGLP